MNIHEFRKIIDSIDDSLPCYSDKIVTVRLCEKSICSTSSTVVTGVINGFDWDAWQIMINTEKPLIVKT